MEKLKRLDELNAELNMDKLENELVDGGRDGDETASESKESRPENDRQEREQDDDIEGGMPMKYEKYLCPVLMS